MLNPPIWHELAGWASAHFKLIGVDGNEVSRLAEEGDYLGVDIPGPGPSAGAGYDWVRVELLEYHKDPDGDQEWIGMRVRPCGEPGTLGVDTAHFFQRDATSTYIIERMGEKVTARYHGRNEVANTTTGRILDNIRNAVVAVGAMASFSEAQWGALSKGFLAQWTSALEINADRYEIERGKGGTFEGIGTLKAAGDKSTPTYYQYTDYAALPGINYYRLKMIDLDGKSDYSAVKAIAVDSGSSTLRVVKSTSEELLIGLPAVNNQGNLQLIDLQGRVLWRQAVKTSQMQVSIPVAAISAGCYFVQYSDGKKRQSQKIIILK